MPFEVGGDGMAIRGECASLDQYLVALPRRLEKTREHQMQIDRERAHGDNFARPGARHQLEAARELLVIVKPGTPGKLMAIHAELCPVIELLHHRVARSERLQAERVASEIDEWRSLAIARQGKALPQATQGVLGI